MRPRLAAVLARLDQPSEAWQYLEEDLGRGLLDELFARQDRRLAAGERPPPRTDQRAGTARQAGRSKPQGPRPGRPGQAVRRIEAPRALASIALGEFQSKLMQDYGALAGQVATLQAIQATLPADAALVAWVDIPPEGPNAADTDGEHWGVIVRSRGIPAWVPMGGTGRMGSGPRMTLASPAGSDRAAAPARRRLDGSPRTARAIAHAAARAAGQGPGRHARRRAGGTAADRPAFPGDGGIPIERSWRRATPAR